MDVEDTPSCDGLTLRSTGERVLVLGAPRALFLATVGLLPAERGTISVREVPAQDAAKRRIVAGAAENPPLPPNWTVAEYIYWSARLTGLSSSKAGTLAAQVLNCLQLTYFSKSRLGSLIRPARRATVVAAAMTTCADVLALDNPFGDLPEETVFRWATTLTKALEDRPWIVFLPSMSLTSPLALAADEAIVISADHVVAQGSPSSIARAERRYIARIHGPLDALAPQLAERGIAMEIVGAHVMIDLGKEHRTSDLLAACEASGVVVVELRPFSLAFA